jgi:hypothetical protein
MDPVSPDVGGDFVDAAAVAIPSASTGDFTAAGFTELRA